MKHLKTIAILLLLFGVPLGSWYYLNLGYNYRLASLVELTPKDSISNPDFIAKFDSSINYKDVFDNKMTCVYWGDNTDFVDKYVSQYKDISAFQMLYFGDKQDKLDVHKLSGDLICQSEQPPNYPNAKFILIDDKGYIRNYYKDDQSSLVKLIEHTAIVIPRKQSKDIKLKK